ncbi:alpha/beta fold hydrolase [Dietzia sp. PP-33]|jgi:predicted alpha/beta hydrolase|uniref:alpha/beta fold hydrolase n=1 Tax=Dietzia sp. PP-33 TaxID=2957500 RepID=UPI0029A7309D|nr:alpha/beta fold hydrolase [Dietzia sp. PP-33]MDX2356115.1 alpha/beta fold hydrolase [Dietzia sp. PP-33]
MTRTDDPRRIELRHADGSTSPLLIVDADARDPGRPAVLVLPGIAVGARYYLPLARALASGGVPVAITELRGQGESTHRIGRGGAAAGYHESAAEDVPLALEVMERELGRRPVVLLGHSMGAQIGVYHLARHDPRVAGLVAVAAQSPFHRGYPRRVGRRLRAGAILLPAIGWVTGHVPGRFFGADGRIPADRIRDWSRLAASGAMQPARADLDYRAGLARVSVPALAVVIADDPLAPESAARGLLAMLPRARTSLEVEPEALGHNSWARTPAAVVARVLAWMDRELLTPSPDDDEGADA